MPEITYAASDYSNRFQIILDGRRVGYVFNKTDDTGPYYLIVLSRDPFPPRRVRDRSFLSETIKHCIRTHPFPRLLACAPRATEPNSPCLPF